MVTELLSGPALIDGGTSIKRIIHRRHRSMETLPKLDQNRFTKQDLERPAHGRRESLLHSQSEFSDFRGFINLGMIALVVSSLRIAVENLRDHGVLADAWPLLDACWPLPLTVNKLAFISVHCYIIVALVLEQMAARLNASAVQAMAVIDGMHWLNVTACLVNTCYIMAYYQPEDSSIMGAFLVVFQCVIVTMKITSYVAVNSHYRTRSRSSTNATESSGESMSQQSTRQRERTSSESSDASRTADVSKVRYPENVTLQNICYFTVAPTLCYELNFPRTKSIRWEFAVRRLGEVVLFVAAVVFLCQQWVVPLVQNTLVGDDQSLAQLFTRTLKLALPNNVIWLMVFYLYFHSWMNLCAELLRFGDRQFYRDWWNAHTVWYFWRNWNIPVHKWMQRHVYRPLRAKGVPKLTAVMIVFGLSAVLHEVVVSIPLGVVKGYAFAGMLVYVPLASVTDWMYKTAKLSKMWGNVVVWCSLLLGQPMGIILYAKSQLDAPL